MQSEDTVLGIVEDDGIFLPQPQLQVFRQFIKIQILLVFRLADKIIFVLIRIKMELWIIELCPQTGNERTFPALGHFIQRRIIYGETGDTGLTALFQYRFQIVPFVASQDDDGIVIHRLFDGHIFIFHIVSLHTQIYTGKQADEYGQKHEQHTALVLFFHSIHLIQ